MARYLTHPSLKGMKIGQESNVKDRRPSFEQVKQQQQLKKLKKKRRKGR